jgi:hypothetical protein
MKRQNTWDHDILFSNIQPTINMYEFSLAYYKHQVSLPRIKRQEIRNS